MGKRGRPPHPDILTPRGWQVLDLIRQGLTNEQIAQRLDVTPATAKYHVSEILSKLGVTTREEAAAWEPRVEPRRWQRTLAPLTLANAAIAAVAFVVVAGLGILAWGILQTDGDERDVASSQVNSIASPTPVIGSSQQALDFVLEQLRHTGFLQPDEFPDVSTEEMLYGQAAERAAEFGVELMIRPENYVCPQYAGCPYPGEPADARGWLIILRGLLGRLPDPQADGYLVWTGEDGGTITANIR